MGKPYAKNKTKKPHLLLYKQTQFYCLNAARVKTTQIVLKWYLLMQSECTIYIAYGLSSEVLRVDWFLKRKVVRFWAKKEMLSKIFLLCLLDRVIVLILGIKHKKNENIYFTDFCYSGTWFQTLQISICLCKGNLYWVEWW